MSVVSRSYTPEADFERVRQFLIDTYKAYGYAHNWSPTRWEFCRYFVCPVHTYYGWRVFSVPTRPVEPVRDELSAWERTIHLWEDDGEIVAAVHTENEEPGEAWTEMRPGYEGLYPEMLDWAEANLADVVGGLSFVKLYVNEGSALEATAKDRGYRNLSHRSVHRRYEILADAPPVALPDGFVFRTVAEEDDPAKRSMTKSLAFGGGYAPSDWAPVSVFREMQKAPTYRPANDLLIVAPNGDYAAFTTMWIYPELGLGEFEPVGTHPDYQRRGLGTLLLQEGFRRMAAQGCTVSTMDAGNPFYQKVGFGESPHAYSPWIRYWRA